MTTWTNDRIKLARRLWREGATGAAIAAELGRGVSRSSVIAFMARNGWSKEQGADRPDALPATRRPEVSAVRTNRWQQSTPARLPPPVMAAAPSAPVLRRVGKLPGSQQNAPVTLPSPANAGPRALVDLDYGECRWPLGNWYGYGKRYFGESLPRDPRTEFFCAVEAATRKGRASSEAVPAVYCAFHLAVGTAGFMAAIARYPRHPEAVAYRAARKRHGEETIDGEKTEQPEGRWQGRQEAAE